MTTPSQRLRKFATVWNQLKPTPEVYGLEVGHPEREASLTTTDLVALLDDRDALLYHLQVLLHAYRSGNSISTHREAEMRQAAGLQK